MARALMSLGSSLGDRESNIASAIERLRRMDLAPVRVSGVFETEPVGEAAGPAWFINVAALATTTLHPREALATCLHIERGLGRVRGIPGGPRTIDIDLLAWEDVIVRQGDLVLPHPRMHERRFVLEPLAEIAPDWKHPVLEKTVAEMLASLQGSEVVRRLKDWPGDAS
jgi:2-amino-4-hydroxy-6-hydroxymethyldihydropteridine diphosphokinase